MALVGSISTRISEIDLEIDRRCQGMRRSKALNRVFYALTESANHSLLWHGLNALRLSGTRPSAPREVAAMAATLGVESALVNGVIKKVFRRSRPAFENEPAHRLRAPRTTSFPSGHATSAFCAAVLLSRDLPKCGRAGLVGLATAVSYSRVHVRLHHASDVVGGAALGLLFGVIARRWQPHR